MLRTCNGCGQVFIHGKGHSCALGSKFDWFPIPESTTYGPDTPPVPISPRKAVLDAAANAVLRDRNNTHGEPENTFGAIAEFRFVWRKWNMGRNSAEHDVAIEELLLKVARIATGAPCHKDNYDDAAGYAACAYELAVQHSKRGPS